MKLFGWKSTGRAAARPASALVPLARVYANLGTGLWPKSYETQLREGYLHNVIAQRAVRLVAEGVAALKLKAFDDKARALITATSGGQALLETVAAQLLLHGNAYIEILSGADGAPRELYALRPERVSVEADARGWPSAYRYRVGAATTALSRDQLIHIRTMHPLDDHYGLGCLGAASGAIAIHNAAAEWNKALLDNAARPSGALVQEGAEALSGDQFDRLKKELAESFEGAANAGRPMLLEGGLRWQPLSLSPADMDFVGLKAAAAREIALAFGVPPMLLGLPGDATYANYREANRALWRQTILPLAGKILSAISEGLTPWFPRLELEPDLDQVSALSEERERLWAQLSAADFLTVNEKRAAIGLEALDLGGEGEAEEEEDPAEDVAEDEDVQTKNNPWHDRRTGQFTFVGQGVRFGDGIDYGGGSASMSPKPKVPVSIDKRNGARRYPDGSVKVPLDPPMPYGSYVSKRGVELVKNGEGLRKTPYVPSGANKSGVTIGYGYDLGSRSSESVISDLVSVGIDQETAEALSKGAKLKGEVAKKFVNDLKVPLSITDEQAEGLLSLELGRRAKAVTQTAKVKLSQNQIDALVSLDYNIPAARRKVVRFLNQGKPDDAAAVFEKYVYGTDTDPKTGKLVKTKLTGLIARRKEEKNLFLGTSR